MPLRLTYLRMLEPKGHWQVLASSAVSDLTFAWRTRGNTDAKVKSIALAGHAQPDPVFLIISGETPVSWGHRARLDLGRPHEPPAGSK